MNFQDLLARIKQIDEANGDPDMPSQENPEATTDTSMEECGDTPMGVSSPKDQVLVGEEDMDECGMPGMSNMPSGMMGSPKQQDNVTMNVSMNGSGAGGIRSLMDILRNLESGEHSHEMPSDADSVLVGVGEDQADGGFQDATTEPDEHIAGVDSVTATGNDIHSQGGEAPKVNGGGNPMQETLTNKLAQMYQEIKEAGEQKTMSRAAKGNEKYGKDGMKALAKAGREGKDLDKVREKYDKYDEAYNPNNVSAQHEREMKAGHKAELKKKADAGDENAKKRLQAIHDKEEARRDEFNARMER